MSKILLFEFLYFIMIDLVGLGVSFMMITVLLVALGNIGIIYDYEYYIVSSRDYKDT